MCNTAALPPKKEGWTLDLFFLTFGLCSNVKKNKSSVQINLFAAEGGCLTAKKLIEVFFLIYPYQKTVIMNNLFRGIIAGYGANKLGGGCFGTVFVFILIWVILGQCN